MPKRQREESKSPSKQAPPPERSAAREEPERYKETWGDWDRYEKFYTRPLTPMSCFKKLIDFCRRTKRNYRRCLGSGLYGQVYESTLVSGEKAIVKIVTLKEPYENKSNVDRERVESIINEIKVYQELTDKHSKDEIAPKFYAAAFDEETNSFILIMEHIEGECLYSYINSFKGLFFKEELEEIAKDAVDKVKLLHAAGYIHYDLKPQNMLAVVKDGKYEGVRLIDFGSAQPIGAPLIPKPTTPQFSLLHLYRRIGKEMLNGKRRGKDADLDALYEELKESLAKITEKNIKNLYDAASALSTVHPEFNMYAIRKMRETFGLKGGAQRRTRRLRRRGGGG